LSSLCSSCSAFCPRLLFIFHQLGALFLLDLVGQKDDDDDVLFFCAQTNQSHKNYAHKQQQQQQQQQRQKRIDYF
jgi:hypothetical protein